MNFCYIYKFDFPDYIFSSSINSNVQLVPPASVLVLLCTVLLLFFFSSKNTKYLLLIFFVFDVTILFFIIICGLVKGDFHNLVTDFPSNTSIPPKGFNFSNEYDVIYGSFSTIFEGAGILFFSFSGFDKIANLASETINPKTSLPIGIFGALILVLFFYVSISLVIVAMFPIVHSVTFAPIPNTLSSVPGSQSMFESQFYQKNSPHRITKTKRNGMGV
eukprot:TRINITY_DN2095_c1_g1_i2.p1 TRINITY_DN2095_c1_g1~~TRINITY_DN2095_c1_g1_i2.p1  ORF type:complete len:218 (+),score=30.16 TRINITY_DN2095_c1_g1_i2:351-1004(+)